MSATWSPNLSPFEHGGVAGGWAAAPKTFICRPPAIIGGLPDVIKERGSPRDLGDLLGRMGDAKRRGGKEVVGWREGEFSST
mmetsp:Transcript_118892/g.206485  ORF Transcript_118892/g.206485 Transcript_118892/m.206485 type:complete len:82 (+) Transcript_118892:226-471(+)